MNVEGKAAIVTGGGTGVGRATALIWHAAAARYSSITTIARRSRQTAVDIKALGVRGLAIEADVADDAACRRMVDTAVRKFGGWTCWSTMQARRPSSRTTGLRM